MSGAQRDLWGKRKTSWRAAFSAAGSNARKPPNSFFSIAVLVLVLWLLHQCLPAGSLLYVCRFFTLQEERKYKHIILLSTLFWFLAKAGKPLSAGSPPNICGYPSAPIAVCRGGKGHRLGFSQVKVRLWSGSLEDTYRIRQTLSAYELYLLSLALSLSLNV